MATLNVKNFPDAVYQKLRSRAAREHRSVTQEVVHLLTGCVEQPEPLSILELKGLGKELWNGLDAAAHVEQERRSWD